MLPAASFTTTFFLFSAYVCRLDSPEQLLRSRQRFYQARCFIVVEGWYPLSIRRDLSQAVRSAAGWSVSVERSRCDRSSLLVCFLLRSVAANESGRGPLPPKVCRINAQSHRDNMVALNCVCPPLGLFLSVNEIPPPPPSYPTPPSPSRFVYVNGGAYMTENVHQNDKRRSRSSCLWPPSCLSRRPGIQTRPIKTCSVCPSRLASLPVPVFFPAVQSFLLLFCRGCCLVVCAQRVLFQPSSPPPLPPEDATPVLA